MRLAGKRALVTAAGQGIGGAIADAFEREGAEVYALDRDAGLLAARRHACVVDLTDRAAIAALPDSVGAIDVLVNAGGVVHPGTVLDCTEEQWAFAHELNVSAMFRTIRAFLPAMLERRAGSIINVASVASSVIGVRNRFAYGATKAAVIGLTKSVAADFVGAGVRCNAILPGTVDSPSLRERVRAQAELSGESVEAVFAQFAARQPIGRLGKPEEIAALAVHLGGDESAFTTGTTAVIDGGWTVE